MKSKEELIHKNIIDIIATCGNIANANPRAKNVEKNPLTKQIRSFGRAFEAMENEEIMEMAKTYYSKYYLSAIEDESISDWMNDTIELVYGEGELSIRLNISNYFRIAQEIDSVTDKNNKNNPLASFLQENTPTNKWTSTLRYDCLRLLIRMASPAIADKLDEKLQPLEKALGKTPMGTPTPSSSSPSSSSSTNNNPLGKMPEMFNQMMSSLAGKFNEDGGQLKEMMNNPQAKNIIENVTKVFPPEIQGSMKKVMDDLSSGQFDMGKTVNTLISQMMNQPNLDDEVEEDEHRAGPSVGHLIDVDQGPRLIDPPSHSHEEESSKTVCDDETGVCYIQH